MCETAEPEEIFGYDPLKLYLYETLISSISGSLEFRVSTSRKAVSLYKNHAFALIYPFRKGIDLGLFMQGEVPADLFTKVQRRSGTKWVGWIRIENDDQINEELIELCTLAYKISR